jgi:predicted RNA-binding Zn ribbon-like protein
MEFPFGSTSAHDAVLDFLNTIVSEDGQFADRLQSDEGVAMWLERAGFLRASGGMCEVRRLQGLAKEARLLRETIRELLTQRKSGRKVDAERLNHILASGSYHVELAEDEAGALRVVRRFSSETPVQILASVAVAAADLLARGDFTHIRKCGCDACPIWFYDRTKGRRRRWCDLARCTNARRLALEVTPAVARSTYR